jgi:FkbM family methyltransferase
MAYPEILRKIVKKLLASQGLTLTGLNPGRPTMENACRAIASRGHLLSTVIDIGASDGRWSKDFIRYYPESHYLLIEAQSIHEPKLKAFCAEHPGSQYVLAAAGESSGEINFDAAVPLGGQASYTPFGKHNLVVPVTTVDKEVESRRLPGPYLLKLDTHGFEVPILRGARGALESTGIIVMECYNYRIAPECLLFDEMCAHLRTLGFQCIDLADPMFRPHDDTLWQMDLIFVRKDWKGLAYFEYD